MRLVPDHKKTVTRAKERAPFTVYCLACRAMFRLETIK